MTIQQTTPATTSDLVVWLAAYKASVNSRRVDRARRKSRPAAIRGTAASTSSTPPTIALPARFRKDAMCYLGRPASIDRIRWRLMSVEQQQAAIEAAEAAELAERRARRETEALEAAAPDCTTPSGD